MADSDIPSSSIPTAKDFAAAKAVLQSARPDLVPESDEYKTRVQTLAEGRAGFGADKFDVMHFLREPANPMEQADVDALAGLITPEQRRAVYLSNNPDAKMLEAFFDAWEGRLMRYGAMLQAIIRIATDQRRHPLSHRGEREVDQHVAAMKQEMPFWCEELVQAFRFLMEVRLDLDCKPVALGKASAESAHSLASQVMDQAAEMWFSCKRTAKRSQTQPEYLYAIGAPALFYKTVIEKGEYARPNDLAALMRLERAAAERALAARKNAGISRNNAPRPCDTAASNTAAQEGGVGPALGKGISFPGKKDTGQPAPTASLLSQDKSEESVRPEPTSDNLSKPERGESGHRACPRVFVSYSHDSPEHCQRVLQLANVLRSHGVDAELDSYHVRPPEGWPQWCEKQLRPENADFVLMICTEAYRCRVEKRAQADEGRGVFWEGSIIYEYIYDAKGNTRFIPVLLPDASTDCIPMPIRNHTRYRVERFDTSDAGYQALYRELTGQPAVTKPVIGQVVSLAPHPSVAAPLDPKPMETTFPSPNAPGESDGAMKTRVMGEKLLAFVREVLHLREVVEEAMERDDVAAPLMQQEEEGRRHRHQGTGCRRIWTRRDKRLSDDGWPGCPRTERILRRLRPERGEGPHLPLLRDAFDEARSEGTFSHLAPILENLADAHDAFLNHAAEIASDQVGVNMQFPYGQVAEQHDEAVSRIMRFLPSDAVRFDKKYPWDGRHEPRVLCRDLRQPACCDSKLSPKLKSENTANESQFPFEYGSDLHWLWGWGERLRSLLSDDVPPSKHDWMVFRPDRLARDSMMRFSIKYPHIIKQIEDYLDFADARFDDFLGDDNDSTRAEFASAMESLCERIRVGVETIARAEQAQS